jgi:hypothetical protein
MMLKRDEAKRVAVSQENLIIGQMLDEKNKGMNTQEPKKKTKVEYHCDTMEQ